MTIVGDVNSMLDFDEFIGGLSEDDTPISDTDCKRSLTCKTINM